MKIGDKVTWTSQSAGITKTKTGVIVAVVPPGKEADKYLPESCQLHSLPGMPRYHESYLVMVGKQNRLYWPRVNKLKLEVKP